MESTPPYTLYGLINCARGTRTQTTLIFVLGVLCIIGCPLQLIREVFSRLHFRRRRRHTLGSLRYGDYGLRTTAGRALSFVCSTGLSRANIER